MNILFIHVWNPQDMSYRGSLSKLFCYPSLTLPTLAALLPAHLNAKITLCDELTEKVDYDKIKYDIVALSFDTASSAQAYKHAAEFKKRGAYILCGGYHTSSVPEEVALHADTVIVGAGEVSLPAFFEDFISGVPKKLYDNQCYDASLIKFPRRDLQNTSKSLSIPTIIADRGCDNRCEFCAISQMWRSNPRPIKNVVEEIKSLNTDKLIFFDPNFFKPRDYALQLMEELSKLKVRWACNSTADVAFDDELLTAARKSNCTGVLIGFESLSEDSLKTVNKRYHNTEKYKEIVDRMHNYKLAVNGCFVLGFDHDTEDSLLQMPEKIDYLGLDMVRYAILTPLPGSKIYNDLNEQGRIITNDWSKYNQNCAVYQPKNMSPERLEEILRIVWRKSYTWKRVLGRSLHSKNDSLIEKIILFGGNIGFKYNSV